MDRPTATAPRLRRALLSALAVIPFGVALHYVYDWTGEHPVAGIFAALNESTWARTPYPSTLVCSPCR